MPGQMRAVDAGLRAMRAMPGPLDTKLAVLMMLSVQVRGFALIARDIADAGGTVGEATRRLHDTILSSIGSMSTTVRRSLILLSGGLDSSIVAAATAVDGGDAQCVTVSTKAASGDERVFAGKTAGRAGKPEKDADTRALEADLAANLGMSVRIDHEPGGESGLMTIRYNTLDDLDRLCRALSQLPPLADL